MLMLSSVFPAVNAKSYPSWFYLNVDAEQIHIPMLSMHSPNNPLTL